MRAGKRLKKIFISSLSYNKPRKCILTFAQIDQFIFKRCPQGELYTSRLGWVSVNHYNFPRGKTMSSVEREMCHILQLSLHAWGQNTCGKEYIISQKWKFSFLLFVCRKKVLTFFQLSNYCYEDIPGELRTSLWHSSSLDIVNHLHPR